MKLSNAKTLAKMVFYTHNESEFKETLYSKNYNKEMVDCLWKVYDFLLHSKYLKDWVRDYYLDGTKLEDVAQKYHHTVPKVRSDGYRAGNDFARLFPSDIYEDMINQRYSAETITRYNRVIDRLWPRHSNNADDFNSYFVVDIAKHAGDPNNCQLDDEQFDALKRHVHRLSRNYAQTVINNIEPDHLAYCLRLLSAKDLHPEEEKRANALKTFINYP